MEKGKKRGSDEGLRQAFCPEKDKALYRRDNSSLVQQSNRINFSKSGVGKPRLSGAGTGLKPNKG
jgi:hypothetical protein